MQLIFIKNSKYACFSTRVSETISKNLRIKKSNFRFLVVNRSDYPKQVVNLFKFFVHVHIIFLVNYDKSELII